MYKTTLLVVNVIFEGYAKIIINKSCKSFDLQDSVGGERGIRTPGTLRYAGFQDRCIRPLYHLSKLSPNYRFVIGFWSKSECKVRDNNWYHKIFRCFFSKKCMGSRMPAINNLRPLIAINERDRHQNNITT